ncbi:MAG: Outer-membrane lipoprotein carrier protein [Planctomycetes bacterium ADurb.Bin401]|nr:MAG: Outer-membrane lipoprotein carrier protein [Planctomycetes bacterium ADurb.Bin401]
MNRKFIILILVFQTFLAAEPNKAVKTIEKLNQSARNLKNLTADIEYIHAQPLFETQTIRTGKIYYTKDTNNGALRINFQTLKQDDSKQQNYKEDYIFDGMKLTRIDYQSKSAITEQYSTDKPIEPLELVQDYFPIIGLANPQEMTQEYDITVEGNKLKLIPKENSKFYNTYKQIEITIDSKFNLPVTFKASTAENEEITIKLGRIDISNKIKKEVFEISIPADFVHTAK